MSDYFATVSWKRESDAAFTDKKYSRGHEWKFDGGLTIPGSSSPLSVPVPYSVAAAVDPEEAFVASLSSCHMLWFLSIAAKRGFVVDSYTDAAVGTMGKNAEGKTAMIRVVLKPEIRFGAGRLPSPADLDAMHHEAHEECFVANSVKTQVVCEPLAV